MDTGTSLMEMKCELFLWGLIFMRDVKFSKFIYFVGTMPRHHLVYITVIFQLLLSMNIMTPMWQRQSMWDCMPVEVNMHL